MNTRKKTAFGIAGAAATALLVTGMASPALADTVTTEESTHTKLLTKVLGDIGVSTEAPVVVAPEVSTGDVLSGNETASGNAIGSGNDSAIGSGNETGIGGVDVGGLDLGGIDLGVQDVVDGTVGDISGSVSDLLGDIDASLEGVLED